MDTLTGTSPFDFQLNNQGEGSPAVSSLRPHEESIKGALQRSVDGSRRFAAGALGYAYLESKKAVHKTVTSLKTKAISGVAAVFLVFFAYVWITATVVYALAEVMPLWLSALIVALLHVGGAYLFYRKLAGSVEDSAKSKVGKPSLDDRVRALQAKIDPYQSFAQSEALRSDDEQARKDQEIMSTARLELREATRDLKVAASHSVDPGYQIRRRPAPILLGGFVVGAILGFGLSPRKAPSASGLKIVW